MSQNSSRSTPAEWRMRRAAPGDLERVAAIEAACFPAAEACSAQTFAERLRCFADHFRICEVEGDAVGFVDGAVINARTIDDALYADASRHDPAGAWQAVYGINVLPGWRRRGIGAALMREMIALARREGRRGCVLTCKKEKIGWYERLGFRALGRSASVHGGAVWYDMILSFDEAGQPAGDAGDDSRSAF